MYEQAGEEGSDTSDRSNRSLCPIYLAPGRKLQDSYESLNRRRRPPHPGAHQIKRKRTHSSPFFHRSEAPGLRRKSKQTTAATTPRCSPDKETTGLTAENKEPKLPLQALEQQAQLRDALNEALGEEVQRLKKAAGQIPSGNGNAFCRAIPRHPSHQPQPLPQPQSHFGNNSSTQPQTGQSQQSSTTSSQTMNGQPRPNFMDFNPRIQ